MTLTDPATCKNCQFKAMQSRERKTKFQPRGMVRWFSFCEKHKASLAGKDLAYVVCKDHVAIQERSSGIK
jgi:hypothetical protein